MKKQLAAIIISITLFVLLTSVSVSAQSRQLMTIDVPFEFKISGKNYPAGKYTIARSNPAEPGMMILKKKDGSERKLFLTQNIKSKSELEMARVVFEKAGDSYTLLEIWAGVAEGGFQTINIKDGRRTRQTPGVKPERILVAATF